MSTATVTAEIVRWQEDAAFFVDSAKFDGKDRRQEAERWARTTLIEQRAATEFPDDLYGYFSDDLRGSFGEPDECVGYAYLRHPDEPVAWQNES